MAEIQPREGMEGAFRPAMSREGENRPRVRVELDNGEVLTANSVNEMIEQLKSLREQ